MKVNQNTAVPEKKNIELPELSRKAVLFAADSKEFEKYIKGKHFIKLLFQEEPTEDGEDPILSLVNNEKADLLILGVKDADSLDKLNKMIEADAILTVGDVKDLGEEEAARLEE